MLSGVTTLREITVKRGLIPGVIATADVMSRVLSNFTVHITLSHGNCVVLGSSLVLVVLILSDFT